MPLIREHRARRVIGEVHQPLRIDLHAKLAGGCRMQILRDERPAVAEVEAQRPVFVNEQAEAAMTRIVELAEDRLPPDGTPPSHRDFERQGRHPGFRVERPIGDQVRAGMDRLHRRGRAAERVEDFILGGAVNLGPEATDLELVRIGAAHEETNDIPGRDAHAIGIGMNTLDGQRRGGAGTNRASPSSPPRQPPDRGRLTRWMPRPSRRPPGIRDGSECSC